MRPMLAPPLPLLWLRLRAGQRPGLRGLGGGPDRGQARLRRVVGVEEPRLPAVEVGLVADVEEQQAGDGRLAIRELYRLLVVGGLHRLRHRVGRARDAEVRVGAELAGGDPGLDAVLAVEDRQRGAALRRAAKRVA